MSTIEEKLHSIISKQLPGENAHLVMSPIGRGVSSKARMKAENIRPSAVAIVCYKENGRNYFILTERSKYDGAHGGQISFPGGKKEISDDTLVTTAMRECQEEIGVTLSPQQLIGNLTSIYIPVSNFDVEPFLFFLAEKPSYFINEREVATIFSVSFDELIDEKSVSTMFIYVNESFPAYEVPCFRFGEHSVWGATAIILNELKEIILKMS